MKELSLFTGAGGGVLGSKLLGWKTIGYVEYEPYCQKVIKQRISDGILDAAPIFGDIRKFISEGYASAYQGVVDIVSAGFPCQPFSASGKKLGEDDPRNMWPATIECIRIIRPQYALLENVSGLFVHKYIRRIFGDLAESGYDARWKMLSAREVGATHSRERAWIVAYSNSKRSYNPSQRCSEVRLPCSVFKEEVWDGSSEPIILGVDDGLANRVDRLKAIGNGQVPSVVATAWQILTVEGI